MHTHPDKPSLLLHHTLQAPSPAVLPYHPSLCALCLCRPLGLSTTATGAHKAGVPISSPSSSPGAARLQRAISRSAAPHLSLPGGGSGQESFLLDPGYARRAAAEAISDTSSCRSSPSILLPLEDEGAGGPCWICPEVAATHPLFFNTPPPSICFLAKMKEF